MFIALERILAKNTKLLLLLLRLSSVLGIRDLLKSTFEKRIRVEREKESRDQPTSAQGTKDLSKIGWMGVRSAGQLDMARLAKMRIETKQPNLRSIGVLISLHDSRFFTERLLSNLRLQKGYEQISFGFLLSMVEPWEKQLVSEFCRESPSSFILELDESCSLYRGWNMVMDHFPDDVLFITNWNCDDIREPRSIARQAFILSEFPSVDVTYPDYVFFFTPNLDWNTALLTGEVRTPYVVSRSTLLFSSSTPHAGPMWRRELHYLHGKFDERFRVAGDREWWLRLARAGAIFHHDPIPYNGYFINPNGLSTSTRAAMSEWSRISKGEIPRDRKSYPKSLSPDSVLRQLREEAK